MSRCVNTLSHILSMNFVFSFIIIINGVYFLFLCCISTPMNFLIANQKGCESNRKEIIKITVYII